MRITVECSGFTRAADACLTANHVAALLTESLSSRLSATAGMAGDDATSIDFATAYDDGAAEAVAALADLTHAFTGAGRLLAATGDNHERAEAGAAQLPYDGTAALDDSAFARVDPPSPPSSLGAQEPSLGVVDAWILDLVEGFVWPGADVAVLADAASEWRHAAATTARLADHVDVAISLLEAQRSPEVPLAVDALTELTTLIGDTAWQLSNLATACEEYAAAVEAARERTRALLAEVAQMIVEGAAISVIVTGLTGGLAGGAAAPQPPPGCDPPRHASTRSWCPCVPASRPRQRGSSGPATTWRTSGRDSTSSSGSRPATKRGRSSTRVAGCRRGGVGSGITRCLAIRSNDT